MHGKEGHLRREVGAFGLARMALDVGEQDFARGEELLWLISHVVDSGHYAVPTVERDGGGGAA